MTERREPSTPSLESEPSAEELQKKKSDIEEEVRRAGFTIEGSWHHLWGEAGNEKTGQMWPQFITDRNSGRPGAEIFLCMQGGHETNPEVRLDRLKIVSTQEMPMSDWMDQVYKMIKRVEESQ